MNDNDQSPEFRRRDFLKGGSLATLMTMLGGTRLFADAPAAAPAESASGSKVKLAVIGLGAWGREMLNTLGRSKLCEVAAICDTYRASLKRSTDSAPHATQTEDYKTILDNKDISAVIVATPTHQHKEIVLAALKAGKHVYCEAPIAHTIEDAREIALAARAAKQQVFQVGMQLRADPERHFLLPFIRSGALGKFVMARAQWHKKQSWRSASPNPDREKELNWRLDKAISLGLIGEIGMHQIDQVGWFLNAQPVAIHGFGSLILWNQDGREVPDTTQVVLEYPGGVNLLYDCSLANSFDADYEIYYGTYAAVMLRESKAWMFKEVDSPLLGWEVYARKDVFYKETGIALVAGGSKQASLDQKATAEVELKNTPLFHALQNFMQRCAAVDDFVATYGADDPAALQDAMAKNRLPSSATYLEGFQAVVTAVKANEAIATRQRVVLKPEWYEIGMI